MNKNKAVTFFVIATFLSYLFFGLYHINKFETADEHYWVYYPHGGRVFQYWNAVSKGDWKGTFINDKPGVTVALISGVALLSEKGRGELYKDFGRYHIYNPELSAARYALYRIPIFFFNGFLSFFFLWAIWKLTANLWLALWSWMFAILAPVLLGISRIVNPDALLWLIATAAILSFLLYLEKQERKYVILTAVFFGFSLLTKYTSVILFPFFFLAGAVYLWLNFERFKENINRLVISFFKAVGAIIGGAGIIFSIFLPAVFVSPLKILKSIEMIHSFEIIVSVLGVTSFLLIADAFLFRSWILTIVIKKTLFIIKYIPKIICAIFLGIGFFTLLNWGRRHGLIEELAGMPFDLERTAQFRKYHFYQRVLAEFRPLVFSLTPVALLGIVFALIHGLWEKIKYPFLFLASLAFTVLFLSAVIQQKLLITFRYGIMLYPLLAILAGIGIWEFSCLIGGKKILITAVILAGSAISLAMIAPFYFNYSNTFLYSGRSIADGWGYGGYEAAEFLNQLPNVENLVVWPDYRGFCPFFKGKCFKGVKPFDPTDPKVDYFVKTRRGAIISKDRWDTLEREFMKDPRKPIWSFVIGGHPKNFIEIYEAK